MRTEIRVIQNQEETVNNERQLSDDETKAFLYKNYPDLYKKMYPNEVIEIPPKIDVNVNQNLNPYQKRQNGDVQKSDKLYVYNKYGTGDEGFGYNIQIKTDMNLNQ